MIFAADFELFRQFKNSICIKHIPKAMSISQEWDGFKWWLKDVPILSLGNLFDTARFVKKIGADAFKKVHFEEKILLKSL